MKTNRYFGLLALLAIIIVGSTLYSCVKEEAIDQPTIQNEQTIDFRGSLGQDDCFEFVYPLTLIFPDGSEKEVQNRAHGIRVIRLYIRNHPGEPYKPTVKFPYEIVFTKDGRQVTILDEQAEQEALKECQTTTDDPELGKCYELIFPVVVIFPDGTEAKYESQGAYDDGIKSWKKENPNALDAPKLEIPYSVILKNGQIIRILSLQDQQELNARCQRSDRPKTTGQAIHPIDN